MRWLLRVLLLILASVTWQLSPARAADRVLLTADGQDVAANARAGTGALAASATLHGLRATALQTGRVRVIVGLRVPFAPEAKLRPAEARKQAREIAAASAALASRFRSSVARAPGSFRSFASIPFIAVELTAAELDRLATDPQVLSITPDMLLQPSLADSTRLIRATDAWAAGFTGDGQAVAVIDTGVDKFHPFLAGRVVSEACYSTTGWCPGGARSSTAPGSGLPCPSADCRHGTHVAGIVAGGPDVLPPNAGVAHGARIIAIQVFSNTTAGVSAYLSDILDGLQRVYDLRNSYSIAAVNLSLGVATRYAGSCDGVSPPATALVEQLRAAGIASVIASGNAGDSSRISFPACISSAVSVGSVSDKNWGTCSSAGTPDAPTAADKVACYSNASPALTLLAPGSPIISSVPGGGFATMHGTSMAAPHVAGAIAVIRQKAPNATVGDIVAALRATGTPVTDYRNSSITTPRIDVKAALDTFVTNDGLLPVNLTISGTGRGTVTFTPSGSSGSCTASCSSRFTPGTAVTLAAAPAAGMSFAGWSGACSGTGTCTLTVSAATNVTAVFNVISTGPVRELSYTKAGSGSGTVTIFANGQSSTCDTGCTRSFGKDTMVRLTATPASGSVFTTWAGACRGRKAVCSLRLSESKSVTATFTALPVFTLSYTKAGAGDGAIDISVTDSVTTCTANCATGFPQGTALRLTARPAAGKTFTGWSGACRGAKTSCTLLIRSSTGVTATFN